MTLWTCNVTDRGVARHGALGHVLAGVRCTQHFSCYQKRSVAPSLGELTTLPQTSSRLGSGHPSPYPTQLVASIVVPPDTKSWRRHWLQTDYWQCSTWCVCGCVLEMFEISLSRGYNEQSFREDLKVLYNRLGIENRRIVFMFSDQHVVEDGAC